MVWKPADPRHSGSINNKGGGHTVTLHYNKIQMYFIQFLHVLIALLHPVPASVLSLTCFCILSVYVALGSTYNSLTTNIVITILSFFLLLLSNQLMLKSPEINTFDLKEIAVISLNYHRGHCYKQECFAMKLQDPTLSPSTTASYALNGLLSNAGVWRGAHIVPSPRNVGSVYC